MSDQTPPRYEGPRELAQSLSAFAHMSAAGARWNREGLRDDSEYRDLGLAAATGGRLGNLFRIQLYNPAMTQGWLKLGSAVRFHSELDALTRELAICQVARLTGAEYEWRAHSRLAQTEGLTSEQLQALPAWQQTELFDARQRAVLNLADARVSLRWRRTKRCSWRSGFPAWATSSTPRTDWAPCSSPAPGTTSCARP